MFPVAYCTYASGNERARLPDGGGGGGGGGGGDDDDDDDDDDDNICMTFILQRWRLV